MWLKETDLVEKEVAVCHNSLKTVRLVVFYHKVMTIVNERKSVLYLVEN